MDNRLKSLISVGGVLLVLLSLCALPASCCVGARILSAAKQGPSLGGLAPTIYLLMALGCGGLVAYHGNQAIRGKPSLPLKLPATWALVSLSLLGLILTFVIQQSDACGGILLLPCVAVAAFLPPVAALSWTVEEQPEGLTWRRASVAFAAGATIVAALAFVLERLLLAIIFIPQGSGQFTLPLVKSYLRFAVSEGSLFPTPYYLSITTVVGLVVASPLVEELLKPLVTLPLLRPLKSSLLQRREAFLMGAAVGAGLAALQNLFYTTAAGPFGIEMLVAQTLGAAVQPLGAGLVTLGWHALLQGEPDGKQDLVTNYGLAFGLHALWNGTALLSVVLWARSSPDTALKAILTALLVTEGGAAWVAARAVARRLIPAEERPPLEEKPPAEGPSGAQVMSYLLSLVRETSPSSKEKLPLEEKQPTLESRISNAECRPDRTVAVWALICVLVLLPLGLALLQILKGGGRPFP